MIRSNGSSSHVPTDRPATAKAMAGFTRVLTMLANRIATLATDTVTSLWAAIVPKESVTASMSTRPETADRR